jgi:hypothetical protein
MEATAFQVFVRGQYRSTANREGLSQGAGIEIYDIVLDLKIRTSFFNF